MEFVKHSLLHPGDYDLKKINGKMFRVRRSDVRYGRTKRLAKKYWKYPKLERAFVLGLLLFSTPAFACDSYEKCLSDSRFHMESSEVADFAEQAQAEALQAIAYKLDEISKFLLALRQSQVNGDDSRCQFIFGKLDEISKKLDKPKVAPEVQECIDSGVPIPDCVHKYLYETRFRKK